YARHGGSANKCPIQPDKLRLWLAPLEVASGEEFVGADRELGAVLDPELLEHVVEIDLDRPLGHAKLAGDLAVAQALADAFDQLAFARREGGPFDRSDVGQPRHPLAQLRV